MADFHLLRPWWLLALIPLLAVLVAAARTRGGAGRWRALVDPELFEALLVPGHGGTRRWPLALAALGGMVLVLALSGPTWQRAPQPLLEGGVSRVLLLDLSPSMGAADLAPSRLARARFELLDLLRGQRDGAVALIAFGAEPFLVSPLTTDARTIAAQVPLLEPALLPVEGPRRTDLALAEAGALLDRAGARHGEVVLLTDALDGPAAALAAARALRAAGHRLSVLALGRPGGAPLPLAEGGLVTDAEGAVRLAPFTPEALRSLARVGGGRYLEARADGRDTERLLALGDPSPGEHEQLVARWRDQGPWLLLALLPLAALAFRRGWLLVVAVLVWPAPPARADGWDWLWWRPDQQGARALAAGDAAGAAEYFRDPAWRATALQRAGDPAAALAALAGVPGVEAEYNRGNALARLGRLDEAAAAYRRVLESDPDHADARHNLELVETARERTPPEDADEPGDNGGSGDDDSAAGERSGRESDGPTDAAPAAEDETTPDPNGDEPPASRPDDSPSTRDDGVGDDPESESGAEDGGTGRGAGTEAAGAREAADADLGDERARALDAQLRRVPDDPGGLLRERFLLQHLRREGRLP
ncbi:VWA domain-containing protein [Marichromatium sp. PS1]|uniref:VWA domain-containing protein n=1 Tax=Marichromatium sp. PS1 TaxID=3138932 RepID=UPI0032E5F0A4